MPANSSYITIFHLDGDRATNIHGYIIQLYAVKYGELYKSLARVFNTFLPYFEKKKRAYLRAVRTLPEDEEGMRDIDRKWCPNMEEKMWIMKGREFIKIVEIMKKILLEEVFRVEGMGSDNKIKKGLHSLERVVENSGGDIVFRRFFLRLNLCEFHE